MDEQLALLEKSYELAEKYNTNSSPNGREKHSENRRLSSEKATRNKSGVDETEIANVKQVEST